MLPNRERFNLSIRHVVIETKVWDVYVAYRSSDIKYISGRTKMSRACCSIGVIAKSLIITCCSCDPCRFLHGGLLPSAAWNTKVYKKMRLELTGSSIWYKVCFNARHATRIRCRLAYQLKFLLSIEKKKKADDWIVNHWLDLLIESYVCILSLLSRGIVRSTPLAISPVHQRSGLWIFDIGLCQLCIQYVVVVSYRVIVCTAK